MTFEDLLRMLGTRYPWASPDVVLNMTPTQAMIYMTDAGANMNPLTMLLGGLMGGMGSGGGVVGNFDGGTDARFPGKKMRTFKNMAEAQRYIRT